MGFSELATRFGRMLSGLTGHSSRPNNEHPLGNQGFREPILLAAFEGWNDAGEAASLAVAQLAKATGSVGFAEIDPEEFFDFTQVRPEVSMSEDERRIVWPSTRFFVARDPSGQHDLIFARGAEPQLRWRTYCEEFVELARSLGVVRVVTFGAYLSEITHSRPVPVSVYSADDRLTDRFRLGSSRYEGPTGIVGVLGAAFAEAQLPTVSVWASVPCHSLPVSPKAALALVRASVNIVGREFDVASLEQEATDYEQRMDQLIEDDEQVAAYVARLEEMEETANEISPEGLAEEIERYLRGPR